MTLENGSGTDLKRQGKHHHRLALVTLPLPLDAAADALSVHTFTTCEFSMENNQWHAFVTFEELRIEQLDFIIKSRVQFFVIYFFNLFDKFLCHSTEKTMHNI